MNLYVVLAIALGAITGVSKAPLAQPQLAAVSASSEARGEQRAAETIVSAQPRAREPRLHQAAACRRALALVPLTGAAAPRAPAATC